MLYYIKNFFNEDAYMGYHQPIAPSRSCLFFRTLDWLNGRPAPGFVCRLSCIVLLPLVAYFLYIAVSIIIMPFTGIFPVIKLEYFLFPIISIKCYAPWIYRRLRALYFKRHHLGGPYGWGHVEDNHFYVYNPDC